MKIAIMQPYFMPYIGYYQLINQVDKFIFYDDVNYIKGGWINRNYIYINGQLKMFTIPIKNISSFKKINETYVDWDSRDMKKLIKTFDLNLKKNSTAKKIIDHIVMQKPKTISEMSIMSIKLSCDHINIKPIFKLSSDLNIMKTNNKIENLISICIQENCQEYINPEGGQNLYTKEEFKNYGIKLNFIHGMKSSSILNFLDDENLPNKLKNYKII